MFANGQVRAANRSRGNRAGGLAVDAEGRGKSLLARFAPDVKNIAAERFPFELNQVNNTLGIDGGLRLDAVVRRADQPDLGGVRQGGGNQRIPEERAARPSGESGLLI